MVVDHELVELLVPVLAVGGDVLVRRPSYRQSLSPRTSRTTAESTDRSRVRGTRRRSARGAAHAARRSCRRRRGAGKSAAPARRAPSARSGCGRSRPTAARAARREARRAWTRSMSGVPSRRAGVADHPRVDQRQHRAQAALDYRRLIADDHREARSSGSAGPLEVPDHRALIPAGTRGGGDSS